MSRLYCRRRWRYFQTLFTRLSQDVKRKGEIMKAAKSRVLQDPRKHSRIFVQMECRFISDEKDYEGLMIDLSQGGALLSSTFEPSHEDIPVVENKISMTIETGGKVKDPMTLKGTIKRSSVGASEFGKVVQLGIEFEDTSLDLLRLISALSKPAK